jgi:peroxiredoxin Q/BCP
VVVGVSSDSAATHARFAEKHRLPFPIVADTDRRLRKLFGVRNPLGVIPGRVTYVIDRAGIVRLAFSALFASDEHVRQALAAIEAAG